jgi:prepilin-type N-terminal cleavage/methylation domain-containing protein
MLSTDFRAAHSVVRRLGIASCTSMRCLKTQSGFTLIELAVVLTVAAMIIAGIIVSGEGVLGSSRVASLVSNIKDLATASREFKVRYSYPPGDLPNAGTHITANGGISASCTFGISGTAGNGIVDSSTESDCALEHLVKAGMLAKLEYDAGSSQYIIRVPVSNSGRLSLWFNSTTNENAIRATNLPCDVALDIDRRLDNATSDNKPLSQGAVTARNSSDAVIDSCTVTGTNDPVPSLLIKY